MQIVPQLYMAIMIQKWVAEISYALNGIGKFSDEVTCSPPRHLNDSLFHNALYVEIVGVPLETLKDSISSINIHGGHMHLATRGGEVYVAAFPCEGGVSFPCEGGVSLLKKTRTIVVILVLLIILGMVLRSYVLLHLLHRSQLQEGLLQAKLIKLKGAIQQAERKNMNKSLAFANTSHDIRTSLAGITGLVGICLADAPRVSELHSNMQQINTCVTKLLGILNSVLDISKIKAGKMQPEEVEFDICQILKKSTDIFHILRLSKGLEVIRDPCDFSIFTSTIVRGDCKRLKQIIDNLLSNAVKFTSEGHVVLRAWARKPSFKKIEVSSRKGYNLRNVLNPLVGWLSKDSLGDNYVGNLIESDPNHIEIIIEVDDTGHEGTGLGLGIVQSFVRLLGGEIKIMDKTPTEKGTYFRFNILLKSCKPSDANVDDESRAERSSSLPTNSIIIKDSANSQIVQSTISSMGFRKGLASDSIHAILFVQGDETTRIMQRWMEISGVEVWVIDHWRLIYSITEKIKNRLGCLGRSKSRSLASLLNTAELLLPQLLEGRNTWTAPRGSIHDGNKAFGFFGLTTPKRASKGAAGYDLTIDQDYTIPPRGQELLSTGISVQIPEGTYARIASRSSYALQGLIIGAGVIDSDFREIELTLKTLITGNESLHFKIVWLVNSNAPTDGLRKSKHVSCHLILQKSIHGSRRYVLSRLIQDFGRESKHDLHKMPSSMENALRKLDSTHEGDASNDSKGFPYDAILMDCEMSFMNGYEATRLIREEERNYDLRIPIITLTAHASPEEERKTALARMDFHLTKSLQANQLLHAINTVIKVAHN
ncbi:hypothetical protein ZIOFF_040806 [Zingiber officinale]|uniref:histidine kinase n=1 Tax=Zingiber officinale TaxID=94328 RepID=A0A8J5GD31_ZINOF|nr:hypothetical protein ZIOFF_040806 [Zingiber officinale]